MSTSSIPLTGQPPYPQFGQIAWRGNDSNSTYEGLGLSLQRAFRKGLLFSMNYTWSHEIDDGSMGSGDGDSIDSGNRRLPGLRQAPAASGMSGMWSMPMSSMSFLSAPAKHS